MGMLNWVQAINIYIHAIYKFLLRKKKKTLLYSILDVTIMQVAQSNNYLHKVPSLLDASELKRWQSLFQSAEIDLILGRLAYQNC